MSDLNSEKILFASAGFRCKLFLLFNFFCADVSPLKMFLRLQQLLSFSVNKFELSVKLATWNFVDRKSSHLEFRLCLSSVRCQWRCCTKAKGKAVLRPTTAEAALRESHKNFLQVSFLTRAIWMLFFSKLFLAYFRLQVLFVSQIVAPVVKICWEDCLFVCKH